ncbi:MAG: galactose-1-epimerase, partial [Verrucomicrobia bacterium]|nr:galactose-1-epimerase [Verrucomicrobiota bacterium]
MKPKATCEKSVFGKTPDGAEVELYTLTNTHGLVAKVMTYGAALTELRVPDRDGRLGDIVLGFDTFEGYLGKNPYFGCTVGRYANRIAKGRFTLDGQTCTLATNNGPNALHGGLKGFDKVVWKA